MSDRAKDNNVMQGIEGKPKLSSMLLFVLIICFALLVVGFSLWNTIAMQHASKTNAEEYASELTSQISGTIDTDQADKKNALTGLSEAIGFLLNDNVAETSSNNYLQTYLSAANSSEAFDFILFLREGQGTVQVGVSPTGLTYTLDLNHPVVQEANEADACEAYIDGEYILFSVPVQVGGQRVGSLVAGKNAGSLRDLVNVQTYRDESNFCVTNLEGKLLIASGDGRFQQLSSVLNNGSDSSVAASAQMEADFKAGKSSVREITLDGGKVYLLSYARIDGEDWMLLTLFPEDMLSGVYKDYMQRALMCTLGAAIIFVVLLCLVRSTYRQARKGLERLAYTDRLTGGLNEAEFQEQFARLKRRENPSEYAVVMLDIKDFKLVNESAGFAQGDEILKRTYNSIWLVLHEKQMEFAARAEMDHYFVCLHENTLEGIQARIDAITKQVNEDCFTGNRPYNIEFWQGASVVDDPEADAVVMMERARIAAHNSNSRDFNQCVLFNDEMQKLIYENRKLDRLAEDSIKNHDFVVYYQPKVSMSTGKVKGAEALVRWQHPQQGLISPADFIPVLEESGRIQVLDRYVFEEVCRWLHDRQAASEPVVPVSVNLSRVHFWRDGFVDDYVAIADRYNIDRNLVEFEVTETVFAEEAWRAKIQEGIHQMHENGFRCAVDDFGVGYSSLSLVHEMDVDILKFDRSFFTDLGAEKSQIIARNLINMASELNIDVVIEGIETQEQIDFLMGERCDVVQGYFYSKPLPEDEFDAFVDQSAAK